MMAVRLILKWDLGLRLCQENKTGTWIMRLVSKVPSTLYFLALNNAIHDFPSKRRSSMVNAPNDFGYTRIQPEFRACGNARGSNSSVFPADGYPLRSLPSESSPPLVGRLFACHLIRLRTSALHAFSLCGHLLRFSARRVCLLISEQFLLFRRQFLQDVYLLGMQSSTKFIRDKRAYCLTIRLLVTNLTKKRKISISRTEPVLNRSWEHGYWLRIV